MNIIKKLTYKSNKITLLMRWQNFSPQISIFHSEFYFTIFILNNFYSEPIDVGMFTFKIKWKY